MEFLNVVYLNTSTSAVKNLATGTAQFTFSPPLQIPTGKIKVCCQSMTFTNYFVNISAALGNNKFYYTDNVGVPNKYSIIIADGSYSVSDLNVAVNNGVINNGQAANLIVLTPNFSTNTVVFTIASSGYQLYFPAGSMYLLLGCALNEKIPAAGLTTATYSQSAPNIATFNSILNIYLHTSLTNESTFSGTQSDVLAVATPSVSIGSIQVLEPTNLIWTNAGNMSGSSLNSINVSLTDQNNNGLNLSDDYAVTILVAR